MELTNEERRQLDPVIDALMTWRGDGTQAWNDLITGVKRILTDHEAAAERRGAVNALREYGRAWCDSSIAPGVSSSYVRRQTLARADRIEAGRCLTDQSPPSLAATPTWAARSPSPVGSSACSTSADVCT